MNPALSKAIERWHTLFYHSRWAPWRRPMAGGIASLLFHGLLFVVIALVAETAPSDGHHLLQRPPEEELQLVFALPPALEAPVAHIPPKPALPATAETHRLNPRELQVVDQAPAEESPLPSPGPSATSLLRVNEEPPAPHSEAVTFSATSAAESQETVAAIGVWKKAVANAIGLRWDHYRKTKARSLAVGSVHITFRIDQEGKVSDIKVLTNTGNRQNELLAIRATKEARIPPIPADRLSKLPGGQVDVELTLTILPHS